MQKCVLSLFLIRSLKISTISSPSSQIGFSFTVHSPRLLPFNMQLSVVQFCPVSSQLLLLAACRNAWNVDNEYASLGKIEYVFLLRNVFKFGNFQSGWDEMWFFHFVKGKLQMSSRNFGIEILIIWNIILLIIRENPCLASRVKTAANWG